MYIQSLNGVPIDDWGFAAYLGAKQRQLDVIFYEDINEVPASKFNIVVGCIEDTIAFFKKIGIDTFKVLNIPWEINSFAKRRISVMTMKHIREWEDSMFPVFIKSVELKKFVPGIARSKKDIGYFFNNISDDTIITVSDVVNFVSEYRCFILDSKILGVKHYTGDNLIFPDGKKIRQMVDVYDDPTIIKKSPIAYSLDVGITDKGETLLVECNDAWSLGNYGLDGIPYTNMLIARWIELTKDCLK